MVLPEPSIQPDSDAETRAVVPAGANSEANQASESATTESSALANEETRFAATKYVPLFVLGFAILAIWNAPRRDFWGEEAIYAEVTHEMVAGESETGSWLIPTLGDLPYLTNPPLTYWLSALAGSIPGLDAHLTYRLPSLLAAAASLWLTFAIGRRLFGEAIAFVAFAMQGSTLLFFLGSAWIGSEMLFALGVQCAFGGLVLAGKEESAPRWKWLGCAGLIVASLTWSVVFAMLFVVPPLILQHFFGGGIGATKQALARSGMRGAFLLSLAASGAWYGYIYASTDLGPTLVEHHWDRAHVEWFSGGLSDTSAPYYYLLAVFVVFLPWGLFLPLGLLHSKDRLGREGQRAFLLFFLFGLIVLSFAATKGPSYLLLVLPAASLMTAAGFLESGKAYSLWEDYLRDQFFRFIPWALKVPAILALVLACASLAGLHEKVDAAAWYQELLANDERRMAILFLLTIGGVAAWVTAERVRKEVDHPDRSRRVFELARASVFLLFIASFLLTALNPVQSARKFIERVDESIGEANLVTFGTDRPAAVQYYLPQRKVPHLEQLRIAREGDDAAKKALDALQAFLTAPQSSYLLARSDEVEGLQTQFPGTYSHLEEVFRGQMGIRGEYVLMRTRSR